MNVLLLNNPLLAPALRQLGHRVWLSAPRGQGDLEEIGPAPDLLDLLCQLSPEDQPDLIIATESFQEKVYYRNLHRCAIPLIYYAIDTHIHSRWMIPYAQEFDLVLVAQRDVVKTFHAAHWLPLCYPRPERPALDYPREIPVSFVGGLKITECPQRRQFYLSLSQKLPILMGSGDYLQTYSRSRIVLNQCVAGDVNFRVFEAMACGALLITPDVGNGLDQLFQPGRDLVVYRDGSVEEAAEKVQYFLQHEEERGRMAQAGCLRVWRRHTLRHRVKMLWSLASSMLGQVKNIREKPVNGVAAFRLAERYLYLYRHQEGIYSAEEYLKAAESCLWQAVQSEGKLRDRADAEALLGDLYLFDYFDTSRAQRHFQRALELYPGHYAATLGWGNVERIRGDFTRAYHWYLQALETHPQEAEGFHYAVLCAMTLSQWEQAHQLLQRAETQGHRDGRLTRIMAFIQNPNSHEDTAAQRRLLSAEFAATGA